MYPLVLVTACSWVCAENSAIHTAIGIKHFGFSSGLEEIVFRLSPGPQRIKAWKPLLGTGVACTMLICDSDFVNDYDRTPRTMVVGVEDKELGALEAAGARYKPLEVILKDYQTMQRSD